MLRIKNRHALRKEIFCLCSILILFGTVTVEGSERSIPSQPARLMQYAGEWVSSISPDSDETSDVPLLRMKNFRNLKDKSLSVEVLEIGTDGYEPILYELMGFDEKSRQIFAAGHNIQGEFFTGKGEFKSDSLWVMEDFDLLGVPTMQVQFVFNNVTDVVVEGFHGKKSLWKTRYLKQNPKNKNIGIQLVSVHKEMLVSPIDTLVQLGRMGYSFVETFVYDHGKFYGMTPIEFRSEVERAGLHFWGSMTFYDLPDADDWDEAMDWWEQCIEDHKIAGVQYLSASNNQIKSIENVSQLKRYCDYYNEVGRLCKEAGLSFVFHNHADEFLFVEGERVYDYFLENTDPTLVSFQADVYWMHRGGVDPVDYFSKYPERFISWHVKDYQELGESGKIDFKKIFDFQHSPALKYVVAEVEDWNFPAMYSVNLAWDFLYHEMLSN